MKKQNKILLGVLVVLVVVAAIVFTSQYSTLFQGKISKSTDVTQGELMMMVVRYLPDVDADKLKDAKDCAPWVSKLDGYKYENYICYLFTEVYKGGTSLEADFDPDTKATRAYAANLIANAFELFLYEKGDDPLQASFELPALYKDIESWQWFINNIGIYGIPGVEFGGNFKPDDFLSKSDATTWLKKAQSL